MKAGLEPLLKDATIRAIDGISRKAGNLEEKAENAITRLLKRWNGMSRQEKENVAGIVIATVTTAVTAIAAMKGKRKTGIAKLAKKIK